MDMGKALGRVRFVQGLLKLDHLKDVKFHLLGCSIPFKNLVGMIIGIQE